ncbi:MAG: hypothetical protein M3041_03615 [Acidobacteriota bacterium]|nr:hypothetical protein [Acidobacteriota bacterium]
MLRGDCRITSIIPAVAAIYARTIGGTWTTETFVQWLTTMSNGVITSTDPFHDEWKR